MCQISTATVMRANRRMIERRFARHDAEAVTAPDGSFRVSVFANGRVYFQVVTESQMREAFGEALKATGVCYA